MTQQQVVSRNPCRILTEQLLGSPAPLLPAPRFVHQPSAFLTAPYLVVARQTVIKNLNAESSKEHKRSTAQRFKSSLILTCSSSRTQGPSMRRRVHTPKDGESLAPGCVEVVVVWDGGHAEAGVVLRSGVCAIAVPGALVQAAIPLLRQFCCFFILTLHTAHYLNSCWKQTNKKRHMNLDAP